MSPPPTLLVTEDEHLVEEVSSLASASGVSVAVTAAGAASAGAAGSGWESAPLVLLGEDALEHPVPSRRPGVLVLTTGGPGGEELWRSALLAGAEQVLSLPGERAALLRRLGDVAEVAGRGGGCLAVMGVRGGSGTSTLATALAHRAARDGAATLLVDTDLTGSGLDLAVGLEDAPGLRWGDLSQTRGSVRGLVLARSLPRRGSLAVLTGGGPPAGGPLRGDVVEAVLRAARPHHGAVVVDAARGGGATTSAVLAAADVLLLLVPLDIGAVVAARRVLEVLAPAVADVRLVLRTGLAPGPGGALPPAAVVDELGFSPAATLAHDRGLAAALGRGEVPGAVRRGALAQACDALEPLMAPLMASLINSSEGTSAARRSRSPVPAPVPAPVPPPVRAPW